MDLKKAADILAAFANKDVANPTIAELEAAKQVFADAARTAKDAGQKPELVSMLEHIKATKLAIEEVTKLEQAQADELAALTADFPELAELTADPAPSGTPEGAPTEPASAGQVLSVDEVMANLQLGGGTAGVAQVEEPAEPRATFEIDGKPANDASFESLGKAFSKRTNENAQDGRTILARMTTTFAHNLTGKRDEDTRILNALSRQASDPAIVAAGGLCTIAEPIRDMPVFSSTARPIADRLPTVGAPHGAVTFFPPLGLPQEGVFEWTIAQDEAVDPDDPTTWKSCVTIDCDEAQEVVLGAIYRCLTIGNFNRRFAPERWDAILQLVLAQQARLAERKLFREIYNNVNTKKKTVAGTGSIYLTVLSGLTRAWAVISQNQRYEGRRGLSIMPSWVKLAADLDIRARAIKRGHTELEEPLEDALREAGIDVVWSGDIAPINETPGATVPVFPASFQATINVDGGVFRLDGGELNLGTEIRDMDLNRQNAVGVFAEEFAAAVVRSLDTWGLTFPVEVCDEAPCSVEAPGSAADAPLFTQEVPADGGTTE